MTPTQLIAFVWLGTVAVVAGIVAIGELVRWRWSVEGGGSE
jgi:hypothetical protein